MPTPIRLAINGYGRIGRSVLRALYESNLRDQLQIVAINELADCATIAHLTKYDTVHGRFHGSVAVHDDMLHINDDIIAVTHHEQLEQLDWRDPQVDIVLECTGSFTERQRAELHLKAGAKKVIFSQPAQSDVDATIVYGVNDTALTGNETIISAASCTTNCSIPVIAALENAFGIDAGVITTIHSAMNDQPVNDAYHHTDLRKTRSAISSIIPVDTGLARGIERILPDMAGKFEAQAMRVPTVNVSAIDLSVQLHKSVTQAEVNSVLKRAAETRFEGVLGYTEEPLASCDYNHDPRSGIVDASQTRVAGGRLVKVLIWFDNEWGFANRMLDVVRSLVK
ncbi:type I glyceraldehyde-3-phosphate dehydrogenase [Microbulbifer hydrolyticus]|uniref:Glyceraldehyde 3-phosphate dehydrogenase/D-erythrose 4-phosphate dehydrogenase n=1 Tax=Microbulbifer hydrolyticus TaxID=48074 RepID=A0A6P1T8K1_9GAMM|nr:type I glyceraldehyde-3-phosphate dehydrogenase [Microbulbifer hydrolyticus]MBB5211275.1 glyceraldehyde 3-phosphate dehydrogenase/D-erythrose 4-phosphate dehydrogenase [Microbulbifer hydrolyticus]QHQ37960.1 type I glyceraldehyde-3-phosphate dehydrogenase [Microbulbifer hydrolyticus]